VLVTDTACDVQAQACLKAGAHGLLAKPFRVEQVREKVNLILGRGISDFIPISLLMADVTRGK
jgi:hypothetical protein